MQLDPRLEAIERMRNQELTGQNRLYQALHGSIYEKSGSYPSYSYSFSSTKEQKEREGSARGVSLKIRILLAIIIGCFFFSLKGTEQEVMVQKVIQQMEENPTIESVTDQVEAFAIATKKQFASPISK